MRYSKNIKNMAHSLLALFLFITIVLVFPLDAEFQSKPKCRCLAFQACWPDSEAWARFNSSIKGKLIKVLPPAAPCHDPFFDAQACQEAKGKWKHNFWRPDQPGAMQSPNHEMIGDQQRCLIGSPRNTTCFQGAVPVYAVNVSGASDVQAGVRFAVKHNLRLVVKNTGHDYLGRSTAAGSLSIWLHHLKTMTFHDDFVPLGCSSKDQYQSQPAATAVTVGAGVQFEELYQATYEHQSVIVGGDCSSVGAAGGYPQGGGHSAISPVFGLGADNILEYEVVTSKGELVVANKCQNRELFWALRGGGGGTYGIVVSATHKTHPAFETFMYTTYVISASNKSSLRDLLIKFVELSPSISDDGWSGYFVITSTDLTLTNILTNKNTSFAEESLKPLLTFAQAHPGLRVNGSLLNFSSFQDWHLQIQCGGQSSCFNISDSTIGASQLLGSRLIPRKTVEDSPEEVFQALLAMLDTHGLQRLNGVLTGGAVSTQPQDNAVNPAWRRAIWLIVIGIGWSEDASQAEQDDTAARITAAIKLLVDITPGSGAYVNEADFNEPDWKYSFFGEHYELLYKIKQKVDPAGLFVCHHCVGSEDWSKDLNCKISH